MYLTLAIVAIAFAASFGEERRQALIDGGIVQLIRKHLQSPQGSSDPDVQSRMQHEESKTLLPGLNDAKQCWLKCKEGDLDARKLFLSKVDEKAWADDDREMRKRSRSSNGRRAMTKAAPIAEKSSILNSGFLVSAVIVPVNVSNDKTMERIANFLKIGIPVE